jgi:hypothetical protein
MDDSYSLEYKTNTNLNSSLNTQQEQQQSQPHSEIISINPISFNQQEPQISSEYFHPTIIQQESKTEDEINNIENLNKIENENKTENGTENENKTETETGTELLSDTEDNLRKSLEKSMQIPNIMPELPDIETIDEKFKYYT